jgi:proteasome lid subunit RPN8/RPN11
MSDTKALWCRNGHEEPEHYYTIHSGDHLAAVSKLGTGLVGIWHSHISSDAQPSGTDIAMAVPGWIYLIYSVRDDAFTINVLKPVVVTYALEVRG